MSDSYTAEPLYYDHKSGHLVIRLSALILWKRYIVDVAVHKLMDGSAVVASDT